MTESVVGGPWVFGDASLELDRPRILGVLNLTPDSFSDGGKVRDVTHALQLARAMQDAGADLIDVGGESTRPGAEPVDEGEELARVLPFLREAVGELTVPLSIDTRRARVAEAALRLGAAVVNDVSGLSHDPALGSVVAESGAGLVLMHMRGEPKTMAGLAVYGDPVAEVRGELAEAVERAEAAGVPRERLVVDPGIGFAKTPSQNLELLARLGELLTLGLPLMVGPSRKRFLGEVLGVPPEERDAGTAAACVLAYLEGARLFRVHDVRTTAQALAVAHAVRSAAEREERVHERSR